MSILRATPLAVAFLLTATIPQARAATEEGPPVTVSLAQLDDEISVLRQTLSRTIAALEEVKVAANKDRDLSIPFNTFDKSWSDLEAQTQKVRQHGTATRARAREHWEAWHAEVTGMQNPKLREKAQKRYAGATKEFEKINEKVADAKEVFAPLSADLKDIHTYLQTDLSKDAVSSLSGSIWKIGSQGRTVDAKLGDVSKQIDRTLKKLPAP
jgi:hypothetical protein